jgi:lipopolysaccharide/colanic/teichoic acid biosynthesis glycosyltransferase
VVHRGVGGLIIVLLAPLLLVVALALRLTWGGPVLQRHSFQVRPGKTVDLFRFTVPPHGAAPVARRLGEILTATGMDELPSLFNVLRGEVRLPPIKAYLRGDSGFES